MAEAASVARKRATVNGNGNGTGVIYDGMVEELTQLAKNATYAKKIEGSVLNEARGREAWALHTTLKAVSQHDADDAARTEALADAVAEARDAAAASFQAILDTVTESRAAASAELEAAAEDVSATVIEARTEVTQRVATLESTLQETFTELGRFRDVTAENFDATATRVRTESEALRDEVMSVLDKRFNHVDQTFASIRGDIEVLKALVLELIKDRIGRPEMKNR